MSFIHMTWLPFLLLGFFVWLLWWSYDQKRFQSWLKNTFGLKINLSGHLQRALFVASVFLFSLGLLDLRGPEEHIDVPMSDQKTIILIDTSMSMLVEDVQPNRFRRALTLARHFIKNAYGHQISIVLFSDISKRLVPFTDDLDLLDARLSGLEDERLRGGGSNISQALAETVMYLKQENKDGTGAGNILLLTDAEENGENFELNDVDKISLAVVGIGTVSGGKIPMRTQKGTFTGYKTHNGKEIISKLDESFLERIGKSFKYFRKWIVLSFNLPTEELVSFFRENAQEQLGLNETTQNKTRPVKSQWLIGAAFICYILSVICGHRRSYGLIVAILLLSIGTQPQAQETNEPEMVDKMLIDELKENWSAEKKEELAYELANKKDMERAELLYQEAAGRLSLEGKANWGTSLLAQGKIEGLDILQEVLRQNAGKNVELERTIHSNIKKFFQVQKQQEQEGKGQGEEKSDNKKNQKGQSGSGKQQGQGQNEGQEGQEKDDPNESENNDEGEGQEQQEKKITNMAQREREIDKQRRMMKVPALLKQLMQDDRALQSEFIDTVTQERETSRAKKDW